MRLSLLGLFSLPAYVAFECQETTEATTSTTGSIITAGGLGIQKKCNIGDTLNVAGNAVITGTVQITGNVGIGEVPDGTKVLVVNGGVRGTGAFDTTSDRRWKKNIKQLQGSLSKVLNITGVRPIPRVLVATISHSGCISAPLFFLRRHSIIAMMSSRRRNSQEELPLVSLRKSWRRWCQSW
jgi:hypothetical protein